MKLYSGGNVQTERPARFSCITTKMPDWTVLEWVQFVLIALIFLALACILGMIIFVLVKMQQVADKASNGELIICKSPGQSECSSFTYGLTQAIGQ